MTKKTLGFDFVSPLEITFPLRDVDVTVTPLVVDQYGPVGQQLEPMIPALHALVSAMQGKAENEKDELLMAALFDLSVQFSEPFRNALAAATNLSTIFVGKLRGDELVALACVVVEVNVDFFVRAAPKLKRLFEQLQGEVAQLVTPAAASAASTGPTPSSS